MALSFRACLEGDESGGERGASIWALVLSLSITVLPPIVLTCPARPSIGLRAYEETDVAETDVEETDVEEKNVEEKNVDRAVGCGVKEKALCSEEFVEARQQKLLHRLHTVTESLAVFLG